MTAPGTSLFVVGANGRTGRLVVAQALAAGHRVTAFVRRTAGLPDHPGLRVVLGDVVRDPLADHLTGHDAVVSALGNGLAPRDGRRPKIVGPALAGVVRAMADAGVARIVGLLSYGAGATRAAAPLGVRALGATVLRRDFADLDAADAAVTGSDRRWTLAHVGALVEGPVTGAATASTGLGRPARYRIRRADVADALLRIAVDDLHPHRRVVLSGAPA